MTDEYRDRARILHDRSRIILDSAPGKLKYKVNLYANCLRELTRQAMRTQNSGYGGIQVTNAHVNRCAQELVELAKLVDPHDPKSSELVLFEILNGEDIEVACIGHYLSDITIVRCFTHRVVRVPGWVHQMMLEATAYPRHDPTTHRIGEAYPTPPDTEIAFTTTLWEPAEIGPYTNFRDCINAVNLLG